LFAYIFQNVIIILINCHLRINKTIFCQTSEWL